MSPSTMNTEMSIEELRHYALKTLNPIFEHFIESYINVEETPIACNLKHIVLGLLFYKESPKMYERLSRILPLPSKTILHRTMQKVPVGPGINKIVIDNLSKGVSNLLYPEDRKCILLFGNTFIEEHLEYDIYANFVDGYEDTGYSNSIYIAEHAVVCMVKGIHQDWSYPVYYGFFSEPIDSNILVKILKDVITTCQEIGLNVISTICNEEKCNVDAITTLIEESAAKVQHKIKTEEFEINGNIITALIDPHHLLLGIRDNLLKRDLIWNRGDETLTAKWRDLEKAYKIDQKSSSPFMTKLTNGHIEKEIPEAEFVYAAQMLSRRVADALNSFATYSIRSTDGTYLKWRARETAEIVLFWDKIFDSCTGQKRIPLKRKKMRCGISKKSPHVAFWDQAIKSIDEMHFRKVGTNEIYKPTTLKNWKFTLRGLKNIAENHCKESSLNRSVLPTKPFNQDILELFFDKIDELEDLVTAHSFSVCYKCLLVNNMATVHSAYESCENIISMMEEFVQQGSIRDIDVETEEEWEDIKQYFDTTVFSF